MPEGKSSIQSARRARRDQCHRARRLYPAGPRACQSLLRNLARGSRPMTAPVSSRSPSPRLRREGWGDGRTGSGELLLEFLSEEIPAGMQRPAIAELIRLLRDKLAAAELPAAHMRGYVTPRRLAVIVDGIADRQP